MKRRSFTTEHDVEAEFLPTASGFDAEFRCLGKRALCAQLPKEEDTAVKARGSRIHTALAESDFSELPDSDERTAQRIIYAEAKLVHEYDFEGAQSAFEERHWDVDDDLNHTWSARIDRHDWQPERKRLLVTDNKSGWGIPPPIEINWQVRSEAALMADLYDAEEAVTALVHPHHPDSLYEVRVYTREDLRDILATVRHNVKAIQLPDQPRTPGGIQCQWCTAKRVCPEYKRYQAEVEQNIADEIEDRGFTALIRRSPDQRGEHVRRIKEFIKNAETLLAQYVAMTERDGGAVSGYRLTRRMLRTFTDEGKAMELVRETFGEDALYDAIHLSLPDLEKRLAKRFGTAVEAKAQVQRVLSSVLKFKTTKSFLEEARAL